MTGALVESPTIMAQVHRRTRGHRAPPAQAVTKKMPQSETQMSDSANKASSDLLDVAFTRLPEVKAVTGLLKDHDLRTHPGQRFSSAGTPRTTCCRLGEVGSQTVGRRTRTGLAIGCLMPLGVFLRSRAVRPALTLRAFSRPLANCSSRKSPHHCIITLRCFRYFA